MWCLLCQPRAGRFAHCPHFLLTAQGVGISLSFFEMRKIKFGKVKGLEIEVTWFLRRGSGIREDRASPSLSPRNLFPGSPSHQSGGGRDKPLRSKGLCCGFTCTALAALM